MASEWRRKDPGDTLRFHCSNPHCGRRPQKSGIPKNMMWEPPWIVIIKRQRGTQTMGPSQIRRPVFFTARLKLYPLSLSYCIKKAQSFYQTHNVLLRYHSSWWPIGVLEGRNGGLCWFLHRDDAGDNIWLQCWCNCGGAKKQIFSPSGNHCWRQVVWI